MGLSGPKKRNKISSDPNNTTWANNTDGYGQKIMAAQGWKAGEYLGAKGANHADHYTAANASHIRVMLREDNLGLGAKLGASTADTFGLATLSGIFGRLNGKSEADVQKQQDVQRDLQLRTYQTTKFGNMIFISGGLLVGDEMKLPEEVLLVNKEALKAASKMTKRKVEAEAAEVDGSTKKKRRKTEPEQSATASETDVPDRSAKRAKKVKKTKHSEESDKAQLKAEKRARKEERRLRRERKAEKRRQKASQDSSTKTSKAASSASSDDDNDEEALTVPAVIVQQPAAAAVSLFAGSRQAVRQRYIMQKRMASMDPRAVQEILMLKSSA